MTRARLIYEASNMMIYDASKMLALIVLTVLAVAIAATYYSIKLLSVNSHNYLSISTYLKFIVLRLFTFAKNVNILDDINVNTCL